MRVLFITFKQKTAHKIGIQQTGAGTSLNEMHSESSQRIEGVNLIIDFQMGGRLKMKFGELLEPPVSAEHTLGRFKRGKA